MCGPRPCLQLLPSLCTSLGCHPHLEVLTGPPFHYPCSCGGPQPALCAHRQHNHDLHEQIHEHLSAYACLPQGLIVSFMMMCCCMNVLSVLCPHVNIMSLSINHVVHIVHSRGAQTEWARVQVWARAHYGDSSAA